LEIAGYILAILVGVSLGLIGGGGSILTVPVLVYLFSVNPALATTYSLFIVGIAALTGTIKHYQLGNLKLKVALVFGLPALFALLSVRKFILPAIPEKLFSIEHFTVTKNALLMVVFAILMMAAAISMIRSVYNPVARKAVKKTNSL